MQPVKPDFDQQITNNLKQMLEEGVASKADWVVPWHRTKEAMSLPVNGVTLHEYQGGNVFNLWLEGMLKGLTSNEWASAKQWAKAYPGATIRPEHKGSGTLIHFVDKWVPKNKRTGDPEKDEKELIPLVKTYWIYNRDQMDGLPLQEKIERPSLVDSIAVADEYFDNLNMTLVVGDKRQIAAYSPAFDKIVMPEKELFKGTENASATQSWYSTLFHEAGHATGHHTRLNRDMGNERDRKSYAFEEVVAELTAAIICARLGIAQTPMRGPDFDRASYIAGWLELLESDKTAFPRAARLARQATSWMQEQQPIITFSPEIVDKVKEQVEAGQLVEASGVLATPQTAEKIEESLTLTQDAVPDNYREICGSSSKKKHGGISAQFDERPENYWQNKFRNHGTPSERVARMMDRDPLLPHGHKIGAERLSYTKEEVER